MGSSSQFYNTFSFVYPLIDRLLGGHKELLASTANALPGKKLLEIGVGNGSGLQYYKGKFITGIDTSIGMLETARTKNPDDTFLVMDGANMAFEDATFDIVVMSHVLAVAPQPERMIASARRVLKPGGHLLILNHFTPKGPLGWVDKAFSPFSGLLHFRSAFYLEKLDFSGFDLKEIINCGKFGYFKLVILTKP
jgi:phosphatidylethanolamine/phosphatidyl-N-methylethanolamine N-methyltransferase